MWFFKRKIKVNYKKFLESLARLNHKILTKDKTLDSLIKKELYHKIDQNEIIRRHWESFYLISFAIIIACESQIKNDNRFSNIKSEYVDILSEIININLSEIDVFKNDIKERYNLYKNSLIDKPPGAPFFLSNCFLTMLWLKSPDPEGKLIPHILTENMQISEIFINIIELVNETFEKYEIIF